MDSFLEVWPEPQLPSAGQLGVVGKWDVGSALSALIEKGSQAGLYTSISQTPSTQVLRPLQTQVSGRGLHLPWPYILQGCPSPWP